MPTARHQTTPRGSDFSSLLAYSWLTGEALTSDHTQISFSGVALTTGYGFSTNKVGQDTQYFQTKNFNHVGDVAPWDFSRYQANLVVINLGTNENGAEPCADFQASYVKFLINVRAKYASAELVALQPFHGYFAKAIQAAVAARVSAGDGKVHYIDTNGWLEDPVDYADGTHPTPDGHAKVKSRLAPLLLPYVTN